MYTNGSNYVWIKNKKNEIAQISLKDLERHENSSDIFVFNGEQWDKIKKIEKIVKTKNIEVILKNGNSIHMLEDDFEKMGINENFIFQTKKSLFLEEKCCEGITELLPWFLGYYVANGSYSEDIIQIATNQDKTFVLEKIQKLCAQYNERCYIFDSKEGKKRTINISSKILSAFIEEYISGYTCYGKHFSKKCFNTNKIFLQNILQGYLDGDGFYDARKKKNVGNFTRKNYELAKDLRVLTFYLGGSIKMSKLHSSYNGKKFPIWSFRIASEFQEDSFKVKEINFNPLKINLYNIELENSSKINLVSGEII